MATRPDTADLLARASHRIHAAGDLEQTLTATARTLLDFLPAGHAVGISLLRRGGGSDATACTDDLVREMEELQQSLGEGPSVLALTSEPVVRVDRLADERRWAGYVPKAAARGVTAQLAVQLRAVERTWGAIAVYSTVTEHLDPEIARLTTLFASHAAVAVERSHREDNLRAALRTRKVIGQAVGIVMERFELDEEMAFSYLVRLSSNRNVKLRDIATELVAEGNGRTRDPE